jgi:toxin-antitoxin system PIN domain toxin
MFAVDTNVLLYAANEDAPQHQACARLLEQWRSRREPWFVTWGICYEFARVVTHPRVLEHPWTSTGAWHFVESLFASPALSVLAETDRHWAVTRAVVEETPALRGSLFHDAHTAILMREHGIRRIVTNDSDFHRFTFLEVVDPLVEGSPA